MNTSATTRRVLRASFLTLPMTLSMFLGLAASPNIPKASADMRCETENIIINDNPRNRPRNERPQAAAGHRHRTGNHYVKRRFGPNRSFWEWWADNNGGWDGNTPDTKIGQIEC